jgi:hypothetical protein
MTLSPRSLRGRLLAREIRVRAWHGRVLPVTAVVALVWLAADAFGCPNCKDAVNTADPDGLNVARGYFYSILLMLAMPCTLLGSFGIYVWRETQRLKRAGVASPEHLDNPSYGQPIGPHEP